MSFPTSRTFTLCLALATLTACGGKPPAAHQMPPPQVGVLTVQPQSEALTKDLVGRLSAFRSADVRARVAGVLLKRNYVEGSDVKQGQLLFQIDPAPLKAALAVAEASLAQAQATYTNAQVNAKRVRELAPKGYVAKSDLDNALAAERTAAAAVQAARANVQTARINLGYASVTAPIAGRAGQQQVTEGALVGSGSATLLTTVEQIDPIYVNFSLSVAEMEQLRQAQHQGQLSLAGNDQASVRIALPDGSAYAQPGTLDFTAATVDPATGAMDLRARIPNPGHTLLPGMYVTIKARLGEQHKVFAIPQQAVLRDTAGAYVFVIGKDDKAQRRDVTAASMSGSDWIVTKGLEAGDHVVMSGVQNLHDGAPTKPSPWQPAAAGGTQAQAGK